MKKFILITLVLSVAVTSLRAQEEEVNYEGLSRKEIRSLKKNERIEAFEALKKQVICQINDGNFVLKANQLYKNKRNVAGVSPQANFIKIEGDIFYRQSRVEYSNGGPSFSYKIGWVHEVEFIDNGPGKSLKVRLRYGFSPYGGNYEYSDITINGTSAFVRIGSGKQTMQGFWGEVNFMDVDNTNYQMVINNLPVKTSQTDQ